MTADESECPSTEGGRFPRAVAVVAFWSLIWLFCTAVMVKRPAMERPPNDIEAFNRQMFAQQRADRAWAPIERLLGLGREILKLAIFLASGLFTLVSTVTSVLSWRRHDHAGRRLTVATCLLVVPCMCVSLL